MLSELYFEPASPYLLQTEPESYLLQLYIPKMFDDWFRRTGAMPVFGRLLVLALQPQRLSL
jgi:hypothetical protein